MKKLAILLVILGLALSGCATSTMSSEKTLTDGTVIKYKVTVNSLGQDFSGSDLEAILNPEGETSVKAGTASNTTSQVTADVTAQIVELVKAVLPYIAPEISLPPE